jgi:hypothetical protein
MLNEADEVVQVSRSTYSELIRLNGGCWIVLLINFVMLCYLFTSVYYSNVMLAWTNQTPEV